MLHVGCLSLITDSCVDYFFKIAFVFETFESKMLAHGDHLNKYLILFVRNCQYPCNHEINSK